MKTFAFVLVTSGLLLPAVAFAQPTPQTCERQWRETYGTACPAGAVFDTVTNVCVIGGS